MIKRIWITHEMLTVENGCMTPTMKLKRSVLLLAFSLRVLNEGLT